MTQPVTSEVALGNSPTPSRKANSTASTPTRSPTHRRHRMAHTETKLDVPRHGDSADHRKLHDVRQLLFVCLFVVYRVSKPRFDFVGYHNLF